jgi:hypothetical protein
MKFKGQPQHYWMIQKRYKENALKPNTPASSWSINHKSKIYWDYSVAKNAIAEYEKLSKKDKWFAYFEYRIIRLEVIGVEEIINNIKSIKEKELNEKQLEVTNSYKEGFVSGTTECTIKSRTGTIFCRAFQYIKNLVSRFKSFRAIISKG